MSSFAKDSFMHRLGYVFKNQVLLDEALHHASIQQGQNNEKLEFFGDRILGFVIAEYLVKTYVNESEGDLSKRLAVLVSRKSCADIARRYDMDKVIEYDKSGTHIVLSSNILGNVCEAVIAALYLDGGLVVVRQFILSAWGYLFESMSDVPENAKSVLQEFTARNKLALPVYKIINQSGPDHAPNITVSVYIEGVETVEAVALSRKEAEKKAAKKLFQLMQEKAVKSHGS